MGRKYAVPFEGVAISAAQDLWEIVPADDKAVKILGWTFSNVGGTADAGDAQEELLGISVSRGANGVGAGVGSGGSSVTPNPLNPNDTAASFTAKANNTTLGTATNSVTLWATGENIRVPDLTLIPEEIQPLATQNNAVICVRLRTAPADAVTCNGTLFVEEL